MTLRYRRFRSLAVALALALASAVATAGITSYSSRATFSSQGSISFNYGFDDLDTSIAATGDGLLFTGDPWTTHGVTYTTGSNLVIGPGLEIGLTSNVFTSATENPGGLVSGTIGGGYDLFGFDLGTLLGASTINISLNTNLGAYSFLHLAAPLQPATAFFGFSAGSGEHFTAFSITNTTNGTLPGLDNVTLGVMPPPSPIPEPGMVSLLLTGLLLVGAAAGRRGRRD